MILLRAAAFVAVPGLSGATSGPDPYTLGYLAGHSDFSTTKRYMHPQAQTVLADGVGRKLGTMPILTA